MVICDLEENLNEKDYYMGVPALVVEIISESTRSKDFVKKLDLYMSTGITEYWIVNPLNREVTVFLFEANDISKSATYKNKDGTDRKVKFNEAGISDIGCIIKGKYVAIEIKTHKQYQFVKKNYDRLKKGEIRNKKDFYFFRQISFIENVKRHGGYGLFTSDVNHLDNDLKRNKLI